MPWELDGFELPDDFERVGPIFAHIDAPIPDLVHELATEHRPLVYLGLGSSASRDLTLTAARALGSLPINVIAPVAHYIQPDDDVPDNVHVTDLLPVHLLGDLIDAAVLHGGQGTVQTACATGVPFVGMGLQPEQTWHVKLCEQRGNAISIPPKHAGKPDFLAAVRRLIEDPELRQAADVVKAAYTNEDGASATAHIIETILAP
jgi:UDP:flavonoid glycosyltransferase YjiC (YdhE family)